jgi:hypothetical protein
MNPISQYLHDYRLHVRLIQGDKKCHRDKINYDDSVIMVTVLDCHFNANGSNQRSQLLPNLALKNKVVSVSIKVPTFVRAWH